MPARSAVQILCGDAGHRARCAALQGATAGSNVADASAPARAANIDTLIFWGHGDASHFCGLSTTTFVKKVEEWVKLNPAIKTVEIITCNARHGTLVSEVRPNGAVETSWVKSYTDQVKVQLKKMGLIVKALPMGMGMGAAHKWSILKYSATTNTWLYVTAGGIKDTDEMWPGVLAVEKHPLFTASKNYVSAGTAAKTALTMRKFTLDFGTVGDLRKALVVLA